MKEENNVKALNELSKGTCMGMDAVKFILEKSKDKKLNNFLSHNYDKYKMLSKEIGNIYSNYRKDEPQETTAMNKVMTWYTIKFKTINGSTSSKLAEILFQGFNMGISEGRKLLNHKNISRDVEKLINEYVKLQEESAEMVKEFL